MGVLQTSQAVPEFRDLLPNSAALKRDILTEADNARSTRKQGRGENMPESVRAGSSKNDAILACSLFLLVAGMFHYKYLIFLT